MKAAEFQQFWPATQHGQWMDETFEPGLVSVIIPTYNRAVFLKEALDSVHAQTYRPIEVLVVDDGSTDNTQELFKQWALEANEGAKFRVFYFQQNKSGGPVARNRGLIESHGEFIQFMDSDDLLHPEKLATQTTMFRNHFDCDYVWSDLVEFSDGTKPDIERHGSSEHEIQRLRLKQINTDLASIPWNVLCGISRRRAMLQVGPWNEELIRWQDVDYMVRFASLRPTHGYLPMKAYYMRQHERGRIYDLRRRNKGIAGGLLSLGSVEKTLAGVGNRDPIVARKMSDFYLGLAQLAALEGTHEDVWFAICGALKHKRTFPFRVKVKIFWIVYRCAGGLLADCIFRLYTKCAQIVSRDKI